MSATSTEFELSRRELARSSDVAALVSGDPGLDLSADAGASVLLVGPGEVRRVDLWCGSTTLVLQGYHRDDDHRSSTSVHVGRAAATGAVARLLRSAGAPLAPGTQLAAATTSIDIDSVEGFARRISDGGSPFGSGATGWVLRRAEVDSSVAVVPGAARWSTVAADGSMRLAVGRVALLWSFVSGVLPTLSVESSAGDRDQLGVD